MRNLLKLITWPLRIILFLLLAILASLNLQESTVNLFLGTQWRAPLAVLLLMAFIGGAAVGVLSVVIRRFKRPAEKMNPSVDAAAVQGPISAAGNKLGPRTHDGL